MFSYETYRWIKCAFIGFPSDCKKTTLFKKITESRLSEIQSSCRTLSFIALFAFLEAREYRCHYNDNISPSKSHSLFYSFAELFYLIRLWLINSNGNKNWTRFSKNFLLQMSTLFYWTVNPHSISADIWSVQIIFKSIQTGMHEISVIT